MIPVRVTAERNSKSAVELRKISIREAESWVITGACIYRMCGTSKGTLRGLTGRGLRLEIYWTETSENE